VTTADRVRALARDIPDDDIPTEVSGDNLAASLASEKVRVFEIRAHGNGPSHWLADGSPLALACLLTGEQHARLLLWVSSSPSLPLEQVEDAMGRLLILGFASSEIVAVHTQLDLEAAIYFWPLVRMGFVWADDPASARDGTLSLTMTRRTFATVTPWGKEMSCSS